MRYAVVLASLVCVLALSSAAVANTSAGDFLKSYLMLVGQGQYGRVWDRLHPAQQRFLSRARYINCADRFYPSFTITRWKVLDTSPETALLPGTKLRVRTTVVTFRYTLESNGVKHTQTKTAHAIAFHGGWRWAFAAADISKIKRGKCWG